MDEVCFDGRRSLCVRRRQRACLGRTAGPLDGSAQGRAGAATSWRGGIGFQRGCSTGLVVNGAGGLETHTVDPSRMRVDCSCSGAARDDLKHLGIGWRRRGPWLGGSPVQAVPRLRWHRHLAAAPAAIQNLVPSLCSLFRGALYVNTIRMPHL